MMEEDKCSEILETRGLRENVYFMKSGELQYIFYGSREALLLALSQKLERYFLSQNIRAKIKRQLTTDDLELIFLRAQDAEGKWKSVSAKDATDAQFDSWAKSRMPIQGEDAPWPPAERADFCDTLWQADGLVMLKRDGDNE